MRNMDQSGFQQGWEPSEVFLFDPQGDGWTNVRQNHIATNVTGQAVAASANLPLNLADTECILPANDQSAQPNPLPWPLPQSNLEPQSSPICHGPTFELSPDTDLPLNAADAGQLPSNVQSFPQNLLSSSSIPYNTINYASFSAFIQPLTTCPAPATQSLGELYFNPRVKSGQCTRCWAKKITVFFFIQ